jgi:hypothetical protein
MDEWVFWRGLPRHALRSMLFARCLYPCTLNHVTYTISRSATLGGMSSAIPQNY